MNLNHRLLTRVSMLLNGLLLPKARYRVFLNQSVPFASGAAEVPMLVVSNYGIFVMDMQFYDGEISGKANEEEWINISKDAHKTRFKNPLISSYLFAAELQKHLGVDAQLIFTYITFLGSRLKLPTRLPANACRSFPAFILRRHSRILLTDAHVDALAHAIKSNAAPCHLPGISIAPPQHPLAASEPRSQTSTALDQPGNLASSGPSTVIDTSTPRDDVHPGFAPHGDPLYYRPRSTILPGLKSRTVQIIGLGVLVMAGLVLFKPASEQSLLTAAPDVPSQAPTATAATSPSNPNHQSPGQQSPVAHPPAPNFLSKLDPPKPMKEAPLATGAVAFPQGGSVRYMRNVESREIVSTLRVITSSVDDLRYVVRLFDLKSSKLVVTMYFAAAQTVDVGLLPGQYRVQVTYGSPSQWLGDVRLFGQTGVSYQIAEVLDGAQPSFASLQLSPLRK